MRGKRRGLTNDSSNLVLLETGGREEHEVLDRRRSRAQSPAESMEIAGAGHGCRHFADAAGFETVWAAEHHCIEYTIAPNPLTMLAHWGTTRNASGSEPRCWWRPIRHPIRLAGEVGLTDLLTEGPRGGVRSVVPTSTSSIAWRASIPSTKVVPICASSFRR